MAEFFREESLHTTGVILLLSCSILCQLLIGVSYGRLIRETENMATTENHLLKQCKLKFINCFQLHEGVPNIPVFAEKFLNKIQFGKLTMTGIKQLSGQLVLLSVFLCGLGACRSIIAGKTLGQLLPWYLLGIGGVYLYFAVSGLVDMPGKQKILKTNLIDYLENHLLKSLTVLEEDKKRIEPDYAKTPERERQKLQQPEERIEQPARSAEQAAGKAKQPAEKAQQPAGRAGQAVDGSGRTEEAAAADRMRKRMAAGLSVNRESENRRPENREPISQELTNREPTNRESAMRSRNSTMEEEISEAQALTQLPEEEKRAAQVAELEDILQELFA